MCHNCYEAWLSAGRPERGHWLLAATEVGFEGRAPGVCQACGNRRNCGPRACAGLATERGTKLGARSWKTGRKGVANGTHERKTHDLSAWYAGDPPRGVKRAGGSPAS